MVAEVAQFFEACAQRLEATGVRPDQIVFDVGVGFGKNLDHNLELVSAGWELRALGVPVMLGASRKSFIGKLLDTTTEARLEGSIAAAVAGVVMATKQGLTTIRAKTVVDCTGDADVAWFAGAETMTEVKLHRLGVRTLTRSGFSPPLLLMK